MIDVFIYLFIFHDYWWCGMVRCAMPCCAVLSHAVLRSTIFTNSAYRHPPPPTRSCAPRLRWMPAHSMQMSTPRFTEAQVGVPGSEARGVRAQDDRASGRISKSVWSGLALQGLDIPVSKGRLLESAAHYLVCF